MSDIVGNDLRGRVFGIWGLAFKPNTDDMREAASITVINELIKKGAKVRVYDPKAMDQARNFYLLNNDAVEYCQSKYTALVDADAMILLTEWKEFKSPDFEEIRMRLKTPVLFDGRNQYDACQMEELGFEYYQIGVERKGNST